MRSQKSRSKSLAVRWLMAGLFIVVTADLSHAAEKTESSDASTTPSKTEAHVKTATLHEGTIPITLSALGRIIQPRQTPASITALAPGIVTAIEVSNGDRITSGAVLMRFDDRAIQVELKKARMNLALAENELRYAEKSGVAQDQEQLELAALQARVRATQARQESGRLAGLFAKSLTSEKSAIEARQAAESAEKEADAAEKKTSVFKTSGKGLDLDRLRAKVEEARAASRLAELECEAMTVHAPMAGRVARLLVTAGQSVEKGVLLAELKTDDALAVLFSLPPVQAIKVRPEMPFALSDAETTRTHEGKIRTVGGGVDPDTGLIRIEGMLEHEDSTLYLGEVFRGEIAMNVSPKGFIVPLSALSVKDEGVFLHRIDQNNQAHAVKVDVLAKSSKAAVVRAEDLAAEQRVIVDGNYNLPDGATVVAEEAS